MILLDTNVVSAVMAPEPSRVVVHWLNRQATDALHLPAPVIAEISFGLAVLPEGRKRRGLRERFEHFVARGFHRRILPFDEPAAHRYGELMAHRRSIGRPMSVVDGQIAAIARTFGAAVATRNLRDFDECDLRLVDPFEASG